MKTAKHVVRFLGRFFGRLRVVRDLPRSLCEETIAISGQEYLKSNIAVAIGLLLMEGILYMLIIISNKSVISNELLYARIILASCMIFFAIPTIQVCCASLIGLPPHIRRLMIAFRDTLGKTGVGQAVIKDWEESTPGVRPKEIDTLMRSAKNPDDEQMTLLHPHVPQSSIDLKAGSGE